MGFWDDVNLPDVPQETAPSDNIWSNQSPSPAASPEAPQPTPKTESAGAVDTSFWSDVDLQAAGIEKPQPSSNTSQQAGQLASVPPPPPPPDQGNYDNGDGGKASVSVGVQPSSLNMPPPTGGLATFNQLPSPLQQAASWAVNTETQGLQNWQQAAQDVQRGDYGSAIGNTFAPAGRVLGDVAGPAFNAVQYGVGNTYRQGAGALVDLAGLPQENNGLDLSPLGVLSSAMGGGAPDTMQLGMALGRQFWQDPLGNLGNIGQLPDRLGQAWQAGQDYRFFKGEGLPEDKHVETPWFSADLPYGRAKEFINEEAMNPLNYVGFGLGGQLPGTLGKVGAAIDKGASLPFEAAGKLFNSPKVAGTAATLGIGAVAFPAIWNSANIRDNEGKQVQLAIPGYDLLPDSIKPAAGIILPIATGFAAAALWRGGEGAMGRILSRTADTAVAGQVVRDVAGKAPQLLEGAKLRPDGAIVDTFNRPIQNARIANPGELIDRPRTFTAPTKTAVGSLARNDFHSTMNYVNVLADHDQTRANGVLTNVMREIVKDPNASADTLAKAAAAVTDATKAPIAADAAVFNMPEVRKTLAGLRRTILNYVQEGPGQDAKIADFFNSFIEQNGNDAALMQSKLEHVYMRQLQRDLGYANPDWASPIRRYASILDDLQLNPAAKDALQKNMRQPILLERGSDVFNQITAALDGRETAKARSLANQAINDIKQAAAKIQPDAQGRRPLLPNALDEKLVGSNINPWMDLMMGSKAIISPFWLMSAPRYFVNNFVSDMLMLTAGTQFRGWHWALNPSEQDIVLANLGHGPLNPWLTGNNFANEIMGTGIQGGLPRQRGAIRIAFDRLGDTLPGGKAAEKGITFLPKGANWIGEQIQKLPLMSEVDRRKAIYVAQYVERYRKGFYSEARAAFEAAGMDANAADVAARRVTQSVVSGAPIDHWSAGVDFSGMDAGLRGTAEIMAREANSPQEFLANWQQFLADRRGENATLRGAVAGGPAYNRPTYEEAFSGQEMAARQERLGTFDPNAQQPEIQLPESVRAAQAQARTAQGQAIQDALRERFGPEIDAAPKGPKPAPRPTPTPPPAAGAAPQAARNVRPYQRYYDDLLTVARQIAPDERTATKYADSVWAIENARAWEWAKRTGRTADDYFATKAPKVRFENTSPTVPTPGLLPEVATAPSGLTVKGEYDRAARIATAYQKGDVTTLIHETTHAFVDTMTDNANLYKSELDTTGKWLKAQGLQADYRAWGTPELEAIARGFERYTAEGIGVPAKLARVFDSLKTFFLNVYRNIKGSAIDYPVTSELRGAFRTSMGGERFSIEETRNTLGVLARMEGHTEFPEKILDKSGREISKVGMIDTQAAGYFGGEQRTRYRDLAHTLNELQTGKHTDPNGAQHALKSLSDAIAQKAGAIGKGEAAKASDMLRRFNKMLLDDGTLKPGMEATAKPIQAWAEAYRTFLEEYAVVPLPFAERPSLRPRDNGRMVIPKGTKRDYAVVRIQDAPELTNALQQSRDAYMDAVKRLRVDRADVVPADIAEKATQPVTRAAQTAKEDLFPDTGTQQPPTVRQTGDPTPIFDQSAKQASDYQIGDQVLIDQGISAGDGVVLQESADKVLVRTSNAQEVWLNKNDVRPHDNPYPAPAQANIPRYLQGVEIPVDGKIGQGLVVGSGVGPDGQPYVAVRLSAGRVEYVRPTDIMGMEIWPARQPSPLAPASSPEAPPAPIAPATTTPAQRARAAGNIAGPSTPRPAPPQDVRAAIDEAGSATATQTLDLGAAYKARENAYAQLPPLFKDNPAALQDAVAQIRAGKKVSLPGNAADAAKRIADAEDAVMRAEQNANAAVKQAFEQAGLTQNVSDQAARDALRTIPDFINPDWRLADGTPYTGNVTRTATGYTTPDGQPLTFGNTMEWAADGVPPMTDILDKMYGKAATDAQNAVTAGMANAALPADIANVIDFQKMRELKNRANINAQQGALADTRGLLFGYDDRTYGQYLIDHWSPYAYWTISHVAQAGKYLAQHPGQYFTLMEVMADWAKQTENESPGNRWTIRLFTTPDGTEFRFRPTALLPFATQGIADIVNLATGDARGTALSEMLNALGMSPHFPIELGLQALTTHTDNPITPLYTGPQDMNRAADLLPQLQLLRRFTNGQVDVENASIFGVQFPPLSLRQNVYGTDRLGADDYWTGVELARRVKDGEITPADAKRAALSVREGKPNDVWLSAQGQAQGDQGKYALMRYFGLPVAVKPNERIRLDQLNADYYGQQGGLPAPGVRLTQERRDFLDANPDLPTSWAMNDAAQNLKRAAAQDDYYAAKDQLDAQFQAIFNDLSDKLTSGQMNVKQWKDAQSEQYQRRQEMYAALDAQFADRKLPKVDNPVFGTGNFGSNYVPPDAAEVKAVSDAVSAYFDVPYDKNNPGAQQQQRDALMAQLPENIRQQALDTIFKNETPAQRYERTIIGPLESRYYATPYYAGGTPEQQAAWDNARKVYEDARYAEGGTPAAGRAALAAAGMPYALYQEAMNNRTGARNALLATPEFAPYKQWRDSLYGPSTTTPSNQTGQTTTRTTNAAYAPRTASQGYSRSSRAGGGNSQAAAFFADGGDYRRLSQSDNPEDKRQARLLLSQAYWNDGLRWSTMKEPPDKPDMVRAQNARARLFETQPREEDSPTAYYRWLVDNGAKLNALNAQLGIEKRYLAGPQAKAMADRSAILDQYVALKAKNPDAARKFYAENADTLDRLKAIADGQPVQQAGRVTFPSTTAYTPRRGGGGGGGGGGRRPAPRPAAPTAHPLTIADFWRDAGPGLRDVLTAYWQGGAFPETARQFLLLLRSKYPFGLSPGVPLEQWLELVRQMSQQGVAA